MATRGVTICVGDIHGHLEKLERLWRNLELRLGAEEFSGCTVIFLGDYNDRGFKTRGVIDFLISLPKAYPQQKHVFLCGNHDYAFMACLGILPRPPAGFSYSSTWTKYLQNEQTEGWWQGEGQDDIHLQGRRWAGNIGIRMNLAKGVLYQGSTYDAAATFESYGVAHGDRAGLIAAVPEHHKEFLRNLSWIHEEDGAGETGDPATSYSRLIAVHAGLESTKPLEDQLRPLVNKDSTIARLEPLYGRKNVWNIPQQLADERVLLVSGHHGCLVLDGLRLIIDEGGGMLANPIAAVILPSRTIVRDTDAPVSPVPTIPHSVTPALI